MSNFILFIGLYTGSSLLHYLHKAEEQLEEKYVHCVFQAHWCSAEQKAAMSSGSQQAASRPQIPQMEIFKASFHIKAVSKYALL